MFNAKNEKRKVDNFATVLMDSESNPYTFNYQNMNSKNKQKNENSK